VINEKVLQHVTAFNSAKGYSADEATIIESIREAKQVWRVNESKRRWWIDYTAVVELNGMLIGYRDAETTGDMSAEETGFKFDTGSICEYEAKEQVVTVYAPKGN